MAERLVADLLMRLRAFAEPNTRPEKVIGYLDPCRYEVESYLQSYPNHETDFAKVLVPALGVGDKWICTRWSRQDYAKISKVSYPLVRRAFSGDPLAISEGSLLGLLHHFGHYTYDLDEAYYPYDLQGATVPQEKPHGKPMNNCCTFVEALLVKAWEPVDQFDWNPERHRQMMIMEAGDYFSPITAAVDSKIAEAVDDPDQPPNPWTLVQGWRHQWRGGHTFLVVDHDIDKTDKVLILESNSAYMLDGVGLRSIERLKDLLKQGKERPDSPGKWWENDQVWTWERIRNTYRYRRQARLKVTDLQWSGLPYE